VCELENEEVRFPTDADRAALHAGFKARRSGSTKAPRGLPPCAGAIDGTHVRPVSVNFVSVFYHPPPQIEIAKPSKHPGDYISRKMRYTMLLQGLVDYNGCFMHSFAGWPGRSSDARLYRVSGIVRRRVVRRCTPESHGDSNRAGFCSSSILEDLFPQASRFLPRTHGKDA